MATTLIVVGMGYRLWLTLTLPVGYDEVFVMAVGLEEMSRSPEAFWLEVPVTRSSAVTPLWWWLQYLPVWLAGGLSMVALRVMPALLGLAAVVLAYLLARRAVGGRVALLFLGFLCFSDVLAFTNCRGEFAESLTVLLIIPSVCLLGRKGYALPRGLTWSALLMTSLGKGVFTVGVLVLAEVVLLFCVPKDRLARIKSISLALVISLLPTAAYLLAANHHFAATGSIQHEAVEATGIVDLLEKLTLEYRQVKAHVVGTPHDAVQVWCDFAVWPATVITALPLLFALGFAVVKAIRSRLRPGSRRDAVALGLLVWVLIGAVVVISRGTIGARFHLLYLPALWMLGALCFGRRSWAPSMRWLVLAGAVACVVGAIVAGPLRWAPSSRFEPMPGSEELTALNAYRAGLADAPPPHGRTLFIDLANYYLTTEPVTPDNLARAVRYARRETERAPDDARGWAYLGEALLRSGAPVEQVRAAWSRSLKLAPNQGIEKRLRELP